MNAERTTLRNSSLAGGFIVGLTVLIFTAASSSPLVKVVSDVFPLLLSICGTALAFAIYRRQVKTRLGKRIWGAMTLGLALWVVGEATWTFYELVLQQEGPYPSLADLVWTAGYIPLILSISFQFASLRAAVSRTGRVVIAAVLSVMIALTLWLVVLPILTDPEAGTPVEMFFSLAYPLGDLILLSLGTALVIVFLGGQLVLSWGAIAVGIILLSISDLLFSYGTWNALYYPDGQLNFLSGLFDTLYISAYVVWTIGLFLRFRLPEAGQDVDVRGFVTDDQNQSPDPGLAQEPMAQQANQQTDPETLLLGQIVHRAHEQERGQRSSGEEDPLKVYVSAVIGLLDLLVNQAGGAGVESAFDAVLNEKARQLGCDFEIRKGHVVWKGALSEAGHYQALLEEAIRYSKSVVATTTIDHKLQEIEKHLDPRIVQAAEENRLRMVRWLDEKSG